MQKHYLLVIAPGPPMILRVPWPMPLWRSILRATTAVMRAHGLRQKDISSLDGLVAANPADRTDEDRNLVARVEAGYEGTTDRVPRFWLYDWSGFKGGHFKLVRAATEIS